MTELLRAAEGSPWLLAFLVVGGFLSYAVERLCAAAGPATRLLRAWRDRELRELRREALVRAERRRIDREDATAREAELLDEVAHLRRQVHALTAERDRDGCRVPHPRRAEPDTAPMRGRRRESARPALPPR